MIFNLIAQNKKLFGTGLTPQGDTTEGLANFDTKAPLTSLESWISNIIGLLTTLGALVFIFMFFYGALSWIAGGDDSSKVQKARDQMIQGIIGLVILVAGYAIIGLIGALVGIDILNPGKQIIKIFGFTGVN